MTDYTGSRDYNCETCGTRFNSADGKNCDCDYIGKCKECGGEGIPEKIVYNCYEHTDDPTILREEIAQCNDRIKSLEKRICALVEYKAKIEVLNAEWQRAAQEQAETIKVLESRCRYKEAEIEEINLKQRTQQGARE